MAYAQDIVKTCIDTSDMSAYPVITLQGETPAMLRGKKTSLKLTRTDKARVIVCALWGMGQLPDVADRRVRIEARKSAAKLTERHAIALRVIEHRSATALLSL